jgi:ABC-type nickel/cobalt efflux system permease component RcnA
MDSSNILSLFVICTAMFFGAFFAGTITCYHLSRKQLAWLNCFAAGLLLGTALGVIIPEGVRSIYETSSVLNAKESILEKKSIIEHHHEGEHDHEEEEVEGHHEHHGHTEERLLGEFPKKTKSFFAELTRVRPQDGL